MAATSSVGTAKATNVAISGNATQVAAAAIAMLLGAFVIGIVGFSHVEAVHNAAHDMRHSTGFPCH